jgi:hypothetical protein
MTRWGFAKEVRSIFELGLAFFRVSRELLLLSVGLDLVDDAGGVLGEHGIGALNWSMTTSRGSSRKAAPLWMPSFRPWRTARLMSGGRTYPARR